MTPNRRLIEPHRSHLGRIVSWVRALHPRPAGAGAAPADAAAVGDFTAASSSRWDRAVRAR